jgi:outer membrane protein
MNRYATRALPLLALLITSVIPAFADDNSPNTIRLGEYWVFYHATASDLSGPYVPAGVNLSVKNVTTPYVAYLRQLTNNFTAELAFGVPPLTKTYGKGPATLGSVPYNGVEISSARWVAPTLLLEYVFLDPSYALRPYVGAGVNYTGFENRVSTPKGDAASGGPTRLELPASIGPTGTIGLTYRLPQHWSVMASYSITRVNTHLSADTAGVIRTSDIHFGPQALVVAAGYSF